MNQKGPDNPVNGIFIDVKNLQKITKHDIEEFIKILEKHSSYTLTLQDSRQLPEPIVRKIENNEAIKLLQNLLSNRIALGKEFIQSLLPISQQKSHKLLISEEESDDDAPITPELLEGGFDFKSLKDPHTDRSILEKEFLTGVTAINASEQQERSAIGKLQSDAVKEAIDKAETSNEQHTSSNKGQPKIVGGSFITLRQRIRQQATLKDKPPQRNWFRRNKH